MSLPTRHAHHFTPKAYQARVRGEGLRLLGIRLTPPDGVVHLVLGTGCRCTPEERLNATTALEGVSCRSCLRHVRRDAARNVATYQRWARRGVPPAYRDKGVILADIHTGLAARVKWLETFDLIHPGVSRV